MKMFLLSFADYFRTLARRLKIIINKRSILVSGESRGVSFRGKVGRCPSLFDDGVG